MFISPQTAIDNGWIKRTDGTTITSDYIQPNAIDFTIDRVFSSVDSTVPFKAVDTMVDGVLTTIKQFPQFEELFAQEDADPKFDRVPMWNLASGSYDFLSDFYVEVPEGVAALLLVRSTFNRGGNFVTSGLYDSGFKGNIGAAFHNNGNTNAYVGKGVRIGQIIFVKSESVSLYTGGYNIEGLASDWKESLTVGGPVTIN